MSKFKHIAVAGNIGAGKTSLCTKLGHNYGWEVHYEDTVDNPYLADFYDDMMRWSFHLQIYFLTSRYKQIKKIQEGSETVIQDRTIYEDAYIFAPNLHDMGLMSSRDFKNYKTLFQLMMDNINPPDLLIYLRADVATLVSHINSRGREYEGNMSLDYLKRLNKRYEEWIDTYDKGQLLIIDVKGLDFMTNPADMSIIIDKIDARLHGLF